MSQGVDLLQGVYVLCCGNRPTTQNSLPPAFPPAPRFTWTEHYLADTGIDTKDVSSTSRDCSASTTMPEHESKVGTEASSERHSSSSVEGPDLSQLQARANEWVSGIQEATSSVISSTFFGDPSGAAQRAGMAGVEDQMDEDAKREQLIQEMMFAARNLEGPVQKYPKSGRGLGLLKIPQERYIAALPQLDARDASWHAWNQTTDSTCSSTSASGSTGPNIGTLSYWEDQDNFLDRRPPKGVVPLVHIVQVHYSKETDSGRSVLVKHKCEKKGGELCDMILMFPTRRCAEEWSYNLTDFLLKLRKLHGLE